MRIFLVIILLIIYNCLSAQIANPNVNPIPPSPNNAVLFRYTETPVSYYNGTTSTSIPMYTITVGNYTLPISINYHSGGIKVNEEASWIGLGWTLSAGGTVSENVIGKRDTDELGQSISYMQHNIVPNNPNGRNGQPMNVIERGTCFPNTTGVMRNYDQSNSPSFPGTYLAASNRQYDLFMYQFNGYSGKLINPKLNYYEDKFISLDNNNIQFSNSNSHFELGDFKAITPDGTVYIFNTVETTTSYTGIGNPVQNYSKHLTSITTPQGKSINFSYKTANSTLIPHASQSYSSNFTTPLSWNEGKSIGCTSALQGRYLDEITWDNGKVKFISDNVREDIAGGLKLTRIEIYDGNNVLKKTIDFTYDYFSGDLKYGDYFMHGNFQHALMSQYNLISDANRKKRLKLLSVKTDDMPAYTFEYNPGPMPYKTSFAKDLWDYFNGVDFDLITLPNTTSQYRKYSLLPDPQYIGYYDATITPLLSSLPGIVFGKRAPNETAMQAGMLTKIHYPTGGSTVFEYEANKFAPPSGVAFSIAPVGWALARDGNISVDVKQAIFTIPTVNPAVTINNGKIDIRLSCSCTDAVANNACFTYSTASPLLTNGLFVSLEIWNGSAWSMIKIWDYSDYDIISKQGRLTVNYNFIQGSQYRITANYPDRVECPGDSYGGRVASICASYYDFQTNANTLGTGGGIRIKTITDYSKANQQALKRKFTYEDGVLMTKPNFIRLVTNSPFTKRAKDCYTTVTDPCLGCDRLGDMMNITLPGSNIPVDQRFFSGYYSEPTVPYSYGANGSLVGYGKVTQEYVGQESNGKTEFTYNNTKDVLLDADEASYFYIHDYRPNMTAELSKPPGIPTIKNQLNGTLKSKTVYAKGPTAFNEVQKTLFTYQAITAKIYWGYKTEYFSSGYAAVNTASLMFPGCYPQNMSGAGVNYANCVETVGTSLYFYPVTVGNVNLVSKTDQYIDGLKKLETIVEYTYNSRNQLQKEKITDSKGNEIWKETFYVADRQLDGPEVVEMQNRNMLDYPVEQLNKNITLNQEISKTKTNYQYWNGTAIILPGTQQSSIAGNSLETVVTYNSYDNKGNILQFTSKDGVSTCFVWAYKQTYPVAKVVGATYAQVLAALGQSDQNLAYLQTMSESELETELNTLRGNLHISLPTAQVSTYLFIPLVGMKQATDPNGRKTYYEYDATNRLIAIKDQNGVVVKTFEYKYKN
jgi:YD repeat-containing protein